MDRMNTKKARQGSRQRKAKGKWMVIVSVIALFIALPIQAQAQPAGSGTEADPYRIGTFDDLLWIANNSASWSSYFIQTADIDAAATQTSGWSRIGDQNTGEFQGSYDGQNFVIGNLHMAYAANNNGGEDGFGLFGIIGSSGRISNLGVINLSYTYETGTISYHGGLAGINKGIISNCHTTGSIDASTANFGGGLVGYNWAGGCIFSSFSTCTVSSLGMAGGLVGENSGIIENSYARGSVTAGVANTSCGGFVRYAGGTISNCYSTGTVIDPTNYRIGGFSGDGGGTITNCFWNTETSGITTSSGGTGITTAQMQTRLPFTDAGWDCDQESVNGTDDIWGINLTDNGGFPFLAIQGYTSYGQIPSGAGSSEDPYLIASLENLYWLSNTRSAWGAHFRQTADIDASATANWSNGEGLSPIGDGTANFTGTYDGQGFKIISLTINRPTEDHVGLFGYASGGVAINDLVLQNPTITGNADVGAFVGTSAGGLSLDNCAVTGGSVTGNVGNVGGLVGYCGDALTMTDTYATDGSVTGNGDNVGGLAGYCAGPLSITRSHTTGSVTQNASSSFSGTGGLVGRADSGGTVTLVDCYSTAAVQGNADTGGLAGYMASGSISECYYSAGTVSSGYDYRGGLVGRVGFHI